MKAPTVAWLIFALLWAGALVAASPVDLQLSRAVAQPEHWYAVLIYRHGTWPSGLLYLVGVIWLAVPSLRRRSHLTALVMASLLAQALLHPLIITSALKISFGRLRFHQIASTNFSQYTPFYLPRPSLGGRSFPSGHVATSVVLWPAALLGWRHDRRGVAAALAALTLVWGVAVAWGRILHGAHYLTDTLFSFGLAPLLAPLTVRVGHWYLRKFEGQASRRES